MLPRPLFPWLFALLMSLVMTALMTGMVTAINTGIDATYPLRWGHAFMLAWPIAFTFVLLFAPPVRRLAERICSREG